MKARDGSLSLEEMSGGTCTISNGGVFGSLMGTPILNPPQSAILGMHATKMRAVVKDRSTSAADDVPRAHVRPPHDRRPRGGAFLVRDDQDRGPGALPARALGGARLGNVVGYTQEHPDPSLPRAGEERRVQVALPSNMDGRSLPGGWGACLAERERRPDRMLDRRILSGLMQSIDRVA